MNNITAMQLYDISKQKSQGKTVEYIDTITNKCLEAARKGKFAQTFTDRKPFSEEVIKELNKKGFELQIIDNQEGYYVTVSWVNGLK